MPGCKDAANLLLPAQGMCSSNFVFQVLHIPTGGTPQSKVGSCKLNGLMKTHASKAVIALHMQQEAAADAEKLY